MSAKAVISIGSNLQGARAYAAVASAMEVLAADFKETGRSSVYRTQAVGNHATGMYCNAVQAVEVETENPDEVVNRLKQIERAAGRVSGSSEVAIDLDLVIFGNRILRPGDMLRSYFAKGYAELSCSL